MDAVDESTGGSPPVELSAEIGRKGCGQMGRGEVERLRRGIVYRR